MAAHRPSLADYLLGPNTARVGRHAQCSVQVLRDAPGEETPAGEFPSERERSAAEGDNDEQESNGDERKVLGYAPEPQKTLHGCHNQRPEEECLREAEREGGPAEAGGLSARV